VPCVRQVRASRPPGRSSISASSLNHPARCSPSVTIDQTTLGGASMTISRSIASGTTVEGYHGCATSGCAAWIACATIGCTYTTEGERVAASTSKDLIAVLQMTLDGKILDSEGGSDWVDSWADGLELLPPVDSF